MSSIGLLLIIIAISSISAIAVYIWFRLAKYQYSTVRFLLTLLAGALAFFPALILQNMLIPFRPTGNKGLLFYEFFIRIALTEELSRFLILIIFFLVSGYISRKRNTEESSLPANTAASWYDVKKGSAAGLIAGFGFAILESATYAAGGMPTSILFLRAVTAAPLHAACGARVGSAAAILRTNPVQTLVRIITATAIHGIYNQMTTIPGIVPLIGAVLTALTAFASSILTIRGGFETPHKNTN